MSLHDLRHAIRGLGRSAAFTVTAVLTLALATAALATVFTLANALFFRPMASADPDRTVVVSTTRRQGTQLGWISYPDYAHLRDSTKTLDVLAAHYSTAPLWAAAGAHVKELDGGVVSASFFPLLGVRPALGRFFHDAEDRVPDRDRVAVLGHAVWRDWFDSRPDAIGRSITVNGVPFTIIGVAPASSPKDIYLPLMMLSVGYRACDDALRGVDCTCLNMIGHLAEGRTLDEAKAELSALVPARWAQAPEGYNTGLSVFHQRGTREERDPNDIRLMTLLTLVSGVLLLVCCANLAGLFIARGTARARELAIRASLGASRGRLVGQVLTESLLVTIGGGLLGVLLSLALTRLLATRFYAFDEEGYAKHFDVSLDPIVVVAVVAVSIVAGLLVGLVPALKATRADAIETLKRQSGAVSARGALGRWLVGAQAAIAVALAAVAALLMASAHVLTADINLDATHVALMRLRPRLVEYPPEKVAQFQRAVIDALTALPDVESVSQTGLGAALPSDRQDVSLPDSAGRDGGANGSRDGSRASLRVGHAQIGQHTFRTLGIPMRRGREFDERELRDGLPVAIVNQTLARELWPDRDALDATLLIGGRPHHIVGIVADVLLYTRSNGPRASVYVPKRVDARRFDERLLIRVRGDPAVVLPRLVREVNRIDPTVPVTETITLPFSLEQGGLKPSRMSAAFVSYAAGLAVVLCGLGLYGTLAFSVARRTKEIGIRQAVGATPRAMLAMVVREGMTAVLIGAAIGVGLAIAGTHFVRHLLFGPPTADAAFHLAATAIVSSIGLLACWIPARRAARVEPITALRDE